MTNRRDFNKAFYLRKEDQTPEWIVVNAEDQVLGRLATRIADMLRGKHKPEYTPHGDAGDYVVVVNAKKIKLTGKKLKNKEYDRYTGWMGGYKVQTAQELLEKDPTKIITLAVKRMLPKNRLSRQVIKKLKVYAGAEHPHKAQASQAQEAKAA